MESNRSPIHQLCIQNIHVVPSANGRLPREPLEDFDQLSVCEAGRIAEITDVMSVGKAAQPQ